MSETNSVKTAFQAIGTAAKSIGHAVVVTIKVAIREMRNN